MTKLFKLELTQEQIQHVVNGLNELPAKTANPLVQIIVNQFNAQNTPEPAPAAEPAPADATVVEEEKY